MKYVRCLTNEGNEASLDIRSVYRELKRTDTEKKSGMIRIIDNEGEDYLYPDHWFEPVSINELVSGMSDSLTIHLNGVSKIAIRDWANAKGLSMSALVRQWIDERLDLPVIVDSL